MLHVFSIQMIVKLIHSSLVITLSQVLMDLEPIHGRLSKEF